MDTRMIVDGSCLYIKLPGDLDCNNAVYVREEADRIMEKQNVRSIVFDFKRTGFMDSTGIGVIMGRYKNIRLTGGSVEAVNVSPSIERLLTLSGIHKLIKIYQISDLDMPVK